MRSGVSLFAALFFLLGSPLAAQEASLLASGTGIVQLTPDRATLSVAIESRASQARAAGAQNAEVVARVRIALGAEGIGADDITTAHYNVRADWRRQDGERVRDGYVAETMLQVALDNITAAGKAIDAALEAGANRIDGVQFSSSHADEARREAIALAVQDAMATAEAMATAAGGSLGVLIELTTEGPTRPVVTMRAMRAELAYADAPTEITPGDLTVTARVIGRWKYDGS